MSEPSRMHRPERRVFVELNPFHAVTLLPYYCSASEDRRDTVFANQRLFREELFEAIPGPKRAFSCMQLLRFIWKERINRVCFNTINATLSPLTRETITLNLLTLLLPILSRISGCRTEAIVHEADQFFATGIDSCRRHQWFRRAIGWWFIKLFDVKYVLAPEVAEFLRARGIGVRVLDSEALMLAPTIPLTPAVPSDETILCWIGPIVSFRRNWRPLVELNATELRERQISIVMLCDSEVGDGPQLREAIREHGLDSRFMFLPGRPNDAELFSWVRRSAAVLCLYGGPEYGTTKTSGARLIASAFRKPYIATNPTLGVYDFDGAPLSACDGLSECVTTFARSARHASTT
jgi:hypothetical protein